MPISDCDGYPSRDRIEVRSILFCAIQNARLEPFMVSDYAHRRNPRAHDPKPVQDSNRVCDVSARNPIVYFELGIRLAFNKPTIIVKDNTTNCEFDTRVIDNGTYKHFLDNLADVKPSHSQSTELPIFDIIAKRLNDIETSISRMKIQSASIRASNDRKPRYSPRSTYQVHQTPLP